jgi:hypothetical protein
MELGGLYQTIGKGLLIIGSAGSSFTQVSRGLSTVATRTSAGIYVMTLAQPVSPAGAKVTAAILGAAAGGGSITVVPDGTGTAWTITTLVGGSAADVNFSVAIEQLDGT